jgi:sRNA-binding carbon storage regulator CsrA
MLALARRTGKKVGLFKDGQLVAEITLVRVKGRQVTLGVWAMPDLTILRGELYERALESSPPSGTQA